MQSRCPNCTNKLPRVGISGGREEAGLVILGESIGPRAQTGSKPFSDDTKVGKFIRAVAEKNGIDIDDDCFLINAVNCDLTGVDETRRIDTAFKCIARVYEEIFSHPRKMVVVLGSIAGKVFNEFSHSDPDAAKAHTIKGKSGGSYRHILTDPKSGREVTVVYTYHPSLFRNLGDDRIESEKKICAEDLARAFTEYKKIA